MTCALCERPGCTLYTCSVYGRTSPRSWGTRPPRRSSSSAHTTPLAVAHSLSLAVCSLTQHSQVLSVLSTERHSELWETQTDQLHTAQQRQPTNSVCFAKAARCLRQHGQTPVAPHRHTSPCRVVKKYKVFNMCPNKKHTIEPYPYTCEEGTPENGSIQRQLY